MIVPLHNYAHYVTEALDSVAAQTAADLDLVVVDDCSTDAGLQVVHKWMEANASRFRKALLLRHSVNSGLAATRNTAFGRCETEFVLPLDADNQLYPTCLQKLTDSLASTPAAFAYCILERFGDGDAAAPFLMNFYPWCPEDLFKANTIDAMALLRRTIWEDAGGYTAGMPCTGWEDYDFWFKIARLGARGLHVPQILARYRVHPTSMLNTITNRGENPQSLTIHLRSTYPEFFGDTDPDGGSAGDPRGASFEPAATPQIPGAGDLIDAIDPCDEMFTGDTGHYFRTGRSALDAITAALRTVGRDTCRSILDLPCGHGRVMRHLRAAFPDAMITACDLNRDAVDYCVRTFDAAGVYADRSVGDTVVAGSFDLIWCGSLLTHLPRPLWGDLLSWFARRLTPDGVLVFTTHGQLSADWIRRGTHTYGIAAGDLPGLLDSYTGTGFGYVPYPGGAPDYGISLSSAQWVLEQVRQQPGLGVVLVKEKGWDNHQDVYACVTADGARFSDAQKRDSAGMSAENSTNPPIRFPYE